MTTLKEISQHLERKENKQKFCFLLLFSEYFFSCDSVFNDTPAETINSQQQYTSQQLTDVLV